MWWAHLVSCVWSWWAMAYLLSSSLLKKSVKNAYKVEKWSEYELGSWAAFGRMKTKHRCCRTTAEPFIFLRRARHVTML